MKSPEYKRLLNSMLRTSQQITLSVAQDDIRKMQLWTILLKSQIEEALGLLAEKNNVKEQ